jgi:abortive infection bacteriophage resistance protein
MPKQGGHSSQRAFVEVLQASAEHSRPAPAVRDRGLLVGSDDLALNALELIGYYRLSAYWLFFEEHPASGETRSHRFKPGSTFEQVIDLYNKDRLIRLLVIDAIERIEIAARSAWVQEMSMKHGPHCYLDPQLFRPDFNHGEQLEQLRSQLQQSCSHPRTCTTTLS